MRILMLIVLPLGILLAQPGSTRSAPILPPYFKDSKESYYFRIRGIVPPAQDGAGLTLSGGFWILDVTFTDTDDPLSVRAKGGAQHISHPDGDEHAADADKGGIFRFDLFVNEAMPVARKKMPVEHLLSHKDEHKARLKLRSDTGRYSFATRGKHLGGEIRDGASGDGGRTKSSSEKIFPSAGSTGGHVDFALADFDTFDFSKVIALGGMTINPTLIDFNLGMEFFPTSEPDIFDTQVTDLTFEYMPFSLPGHPGILVSRQVLAPGNAETGVLDLDVGLLDLVANTAWLDVNGNVVAWTEQQFTFDVTLSDAGRLESIDGVEGVSTFEVSPEPSSLAILGIGVAGVVAWFGRGRRRADGSGPRHRLRGSVRARPNRRSRCTLARRHLPKASRVAAESG